jgi:hypothetical protein
MKSLECVHGYSYIGNVSQSPVSNIECSISISILLSTILAYEQSLCLSHSSLTTFSASLRCPIFKYFEYFDTSRGSLVCQIFCELEIWKSFLLNFLPLPFFFSWFRKPLSLSNTINESVSIARLTISLVILWIISFAILLS